MRRTGILITIAIVCLVVGYFFFFNDSNDSFIIPNQVDVYNKGKHLVVNNLSSDDLTLIKNNWEKLSNGREFIYEGFSDERYRSFNYPQIYQMVIFKYKEPITFKGVPTKEINFIYFDDDPYLRDRVYLKSESNGKWHFITTDVDLKLMIQETVSSLMK